MTGISQLWRKHNNTAIKSSLGYVIERSAFPGQSVDTVFICWKPDGQMLGGVSGTGIDGGRAKAMCDQDAGIGR
jgi:hypothetical protein